jgi:type II secretory pathway pseudopilin PulG
MPIHQGEMFRRASSQDGFMVLEVIVAIVILSIALLAVMAGYDSAFISLHDSSQKSVAATLANQQLELYSALPYTSIGLNPTITANVGNSQNAAYDGLYATNPILDGTWYTNAQGQQEENPSGTVNDVTYSSCSTTAPNCLPIQTVTGSDGRTYRIETFIVSDTHVNASNIRWSTLDVTVIVRDPSKSGEPELIEDQTAFDNTAIG